MKKPKPPLTTKALRAKLRTALADYMASEGCDCCQGNDHEQHAERLAELLNVPKYSDGSGFDFSKYSTQKQ